MKGRKTGLKRGLAVILASLFVLSMIVTSIARVSGMFGLMTCGAVPLMMPIVTARSSAA